MHRSIQTRIEGLCKTADCQLAYKVNQAAMLPHFLMFRGHCRCLAAADLLCSVSKVN
jgi:hypothetical protein